MKVNNYECGIHDDGEVWIKTDQHQLEVTQGLIYLTTRELRYLLELASGERDGPSLKEE
jgi:hypothetical protein